MIDDSEFKSPESSLEDEIVDLDLQQLQQQLLLLPETDITSPARPAKDSPIAVVFEREYVCYRVTKCKEITLHYFFL